MKRALVCGAGGFIGNHLVSFLKKKNYWVRGVDLKYPEFNNTEADEFFRCDLRNLKSACKAVIANQHLYSSIPNQYHEPFDEIYQLAADMGGAGYIFSGEHDADVMHNSASINLNILEAIKSVGVSKVFYSSSACMYPEYNQLDPLNPNCEENSAYPANPDSEYGWEKLFSERLFLAYNRNYNLNVRIARFHNIFGPFGTWNNGKEKAPAAICRKIALANDGDEIEIWGDGNQTRSFLFIDECLEGIERLMISDFTGPVNIGSDEMVSINQLVDIVAKIANKNIRKKHIKGPTGVRGRNSDNKLIEEKLKWKPSASLELGLEKLYTWILAQTK